MPTTTWMPISASGMPVTSAMGKNNPAIVRVSQLGMRNASASPAPATIIKTGKSAMDSVWIMVPRRWPAKTQRSRLHFTIGRLRLG